MSTNRIVPSSMPMDAVGKIVEAGFPGLAKAVEEKISKFSSICIEWGGLHTIYVTVTIDKLRHLPLPPESVIIPTIQQAIATYYKIPTERVKNFGVTLHPEWSITFYVVVLQGRSE